MTTQYSDITVLTSDEQNVTIKGEYVKFFITIKNMLDDISDMKTIIPLPNVNAAILNRIISYCEHHVDDVFEDEPEVKEGATRPCIIKDQWDIDFFANDKVDEVIHVIQAANYLDVKPLYIMACKTMAKRIKVVADTCNTSDEDTRQKFKTAFGIECDFSEEEKKKIAEENAWIYTQ